MSIGAAKGQNLRTPEKNWEEGLISLCSLSSHPPPPDLVFPPWPPPPTLHPLLSELSIWNPLSKPLKSFLIIKRRRCPTFLPRLMTVPQDQPVEEQTQQRIRSSGDSRVFWEIFLRPEYGEKVSFWGTALSSPEPWFAKKKEKPPKTSVL